MTLHKEGYTTLLLGFVLLFILDTTTYYFFPGLFTLVLIISILLFSFLVSFFRKPDRNVAVPFEEKFLSPCDGKVVVIEKIFEPEFLKEECIQVSVFMSPLNVHINWYPSSGEVLYYKYHPGKYLAAWNPKASTDNERTTICYQTENKKVLLRQVAGALARRIVCYAEPGKSIRQGDELGFIKFGSRVDIYLPADSTISVKIGEVVTGNRTELAKLA
jgi:phosphatidylserine decarboxylase